MVAFDVARDKAATFPLVGWQDESETIDSIDLSPSGQVVAVNAGAIYRASVVGTDAPGTLLAGMAATLAAIMVTAGVANAMSPRLLSLRDEPAGMAALPLGVWARTFLRLRAAGYLKEFLANAELPYKRLVPLRTVGAADPPTRIELLTELLGGTVTTPPRAIEEGAFLAVVAVPVPEQLHGRPVVVVSVPERVDDGARLRSAIHERMRTLGLPDRSSVWLLCRTAHDTRDVRENGYFELPERSLALLLLSRSPGQTLSGLLHASGTLLTSPYVDSGAVRDPSMFFGRVPVLAKLLRPQTATIIVGPRQVGKSSLLKQAAYQIRESGRADAVAMVDALGITDPDEVERRLAAQLQDQLFPGARRGQSAGLSLQEVVAATNGRHVVVMIDEIDGFIEVDSRREFRTLSTLRRCCNESNWSMVLAGFKYAYRQTLDQRSPLFNFGSVEVLGPLEHQAAVALATVPMERIGVRYDDPRTADSLVSLAGASASLIQRLCNAALARVPGDTLCLTADLVQALGRDEAIDRWLIAMIRANSAGLEPILHPLASDTSFDLERVRQVTARATPSRDPADVAAELQILGFVVQEGPGLRWSSPLLRNALIRMAREAGPLPQRP